MDLHSGSQGMANLLRFLSIDAVEKAQSGHPGMPMGMADVMTVLARHFLCLSPQNAGWINRDRLVLSAGHGSMLLYALYYMLGYRDITMDDIKKFRQLGSKTAGHPEYHLLEGIETSTGPLGQGIANGVGFAIAREAMAARMSERVIDYTTYVIAGDGCLMEGISHEAMSLAGHLKLSSLIVLFDDNGISIDGPTSLTVSDDHCARIAAYGWDVTRVDGHDMQAVYDAIAKAKATATPSLIACRTHIGFGAPTKQDSAAAHGAPLGEKEITGVRERLQWSHPPFEVPDDIMAQWRAVGEKGDEAYEIWLARQSSDEREALKSWASHDLAQAREALHALKTKWTHRPPTMATRKSSGEAIAAMAPYLPTLMGGSADLTGSNLTHVPHMAAFSAENHAGTYLYYGVREHAMGAIMNGLALSGFIPYGGTFLVFSDYMRPAIRLSALMGLRVIYVMTHDSIGLGEDGPTHQPVEHLASLRAMPNLLVLRPADAVETAECWAIALTHLGPSVLVLTRQNVPPLRTVLHENNLCRQGAYPIDDSDGAPDITLIATGSEVHLAIAVKKQLEPTYRCRVVSMPSQELFNVAPFDYQQSVLDGQSRKFAIEAASTYGWHRYVGSNGHVFGLDRFGESGPAPALFEHFGLTADKITSQIRHIMEAS